MMDIIDNKIYDAHIVINILYQYFVLYYLNNNICDEYFMFDILNNKIRDRYLMANIV